MRFSALTFLLAVCVVALSQLGGCGGGSTGTGSQGGSDIKGLLVSTDSTPLVNAEVTVLETGAHTTTSSDGHFALALDEVANQPVTLLVETSSGSAQVGLGTVPQQESELTVVLSLNQSQQSVQVVQLDVRPRLRPTATPRVVPTTVATRVPATTPTPDPTATTGVPALLTPAETETPVSEVTPAVPTQPSVTRIFGSIKSAEAGLLTGARIKLVGAKGFHVLKPNGKFVFQVTPSAEGVSLLVKVKSAKTASVTLPQIPTDAFGVRVKLILATGKGGVLVLKLASFDSSGPEQAALFVGAEAL